MWMVMKILQWEMRALVQWLKPVSLSKMQSEKMGGKFELRHYKAPRDVYFEKNNPLAFEVVDITDEAVPIRRIPVYHSYEKKGVVYTDNLEV
jgi:hypothetical protein